MILALFFIAPERRAAKQFKQSENILSIYYLQYPDYYVQNIIYLKRQVVNPFVTQRLVSLE